jgi:hypothetical protein
LTIEVIPSGRFQKTQRKYGSTEHCPLKSCPLYPHNRDQARLLPEKIFNISRIYLPAGKPDLSKKQAGAYIFSRLKKHGASRSEAAS